MIIGNVYFIAAVAVVGGALFGFDISSMSAIISTEAYLCYFDQGGIVNGKCTGPSPDVQGMKRFLLSIAIVAKANLIQVVSLLLCPLEVGLELYCPGISQTCLVERDPFKLVPSSGKYSQFSYFT